jgi:RecA/RadA recombinase
LSIEALLSKLDKKTAARIKLASEVQLTRHPYKSLGLTADTGGWVEGHIHLLYGDKSAGKSLLLYQTIGKMQKLYPEFTAAIIDAEGTYDRDFAASLGVDNDRVIISHAKSFEEAQDMAVRFIEAGVSFLMIDSISTLIPMAFFDKDGSISGADGMKQIGVRAKSVGLMINAMHYVNDRTAIFMISHVKMQITQQGASKGYDGGKASEHGCTQIIRLSSSTAASRQIDGEVYRNGQVFKQSAGREVTYFVEKNKSGLTSAAGEYDMYYGGPEVGIDNLKETILLGKKFGFIESGGAGWVTINGRKIQGPEKIAEYLMSDLDYYEELQSKVLTAIG